MGSIKSSDGIVRGQSLSIITKDITLSNIQILVIKSLWFHLPHQEVFKINLNNVCISITDVILIED
jgi:hypothetical protein